MATEDTADKTLEDGAQDTATQKAEDSAQQQADDASALSVDTSQDDAGKDVKEVEGLKAGIVDERKKRQAAETQLQTAQAQNLAYQQQTIQKQPESTYEQAVRELGLKDESFLMPEQQAQIFARKDQLDAQKQQQQYAQNQNAQFAATHADCGEVVGSTIAGVFVPSQELQALLAKKPYLLAIANSSVQAAYDLVMQERNLAEYAKAQTVTTERDNRQKADARTSPMSARGAGGQAEGQFQTAEQVTAMEARLAAGEFPTKRQ